MVIIRSISEAHQSTLQSSQPDADLPSQLTSWRKSARLTNGYIGQNDRHIILLEELNGQTPENGRPVRKITRKSPRFQVNGACEDDQIEGSPRPEGPHGVVRRSTRYQQSMIDYLIPNAAEAVLHKIDDMNKMRCHLKNSEQTRISSKAQRKKTTDCPTVKAVSKQETEEYSGDDGEEDDDDEDHGDEEHDKDDNNSKRYEPRQKKAVLCYQAPLDGYYSLLN